MTAPPRAIYRATVRVQAYVQGSAYVLGEPYDVAAYGETEDAARAACEAAVEQRSSCPLYPLTFGSPDLDPDEHFSGAIATELVQSAQCAQCGARTQAGRLHVSSEEPTELVCHRCHAHLWGECPDCGAPEEVACDCGEPQPVAWPWCGNCGAPRHIGCTCATELDRPEMPLTAAECGREGR